MEHQSNLKIAYNFAFDVQEKSSGKNFIESLRNVMKDYVGKIDSTKSTDSILAFTDNSGCQFEGHNIVIIDSIDANGAIDANGVYHKV